MVALLILGCAPEVGSTADRVRFLSPADSSFLSEFQSVDFAGELSDPWRSAADLTWRVESDVAGELTGGSTFDGPRFTLHFAGGLEPTQHRFTVTASDDGWLAQDRVSSIVVSNSRPYSALLEPADGGVYPLGEAVRVAGDFDDPETEDASTITLSWTGNASYHGDPPDHPSAEGLVDFELVDLPAGEHTLGVRSTDRHGESDETEARFRVE